MAGTFAKGFIQERMEYVMPRDNDKRTVVKEV